MRLNGNGWQALHTRFTSDCRNHLWANCLRESGSGKACIKDTIVMVSVVLDNLADGVPERELIKSYRALTSESIRAAVTYAPELAR